MRGIMKVTSRKWAYLLMAIFVINCARFLSAPGFGQGRGHGRGLDKKAGKFINGHDARDGRWDGRGPRPRVVFSRPYYRTPYGERARWRHGHKRHFRYHD